MKSRFGLIRSREFVMKDCYSFDIDSETAEQTFEQFNEIYEKIFRTIGVPFVKGEWQIKGETNQSRAQFNKQFYFVVQAKLKVIRAQ